MTNSTYRYPPDEFDVAVPGGAPVGVHRAPRSGWSSAWPFLLVALVCAGVAWGGITLLSGGGDEGGSVAEPTANVSADPSASPSGSADGEGGGETEGEDGEGDGEPSADPSEGGDEDALPGDPALADLTVTIGIYNDGAGQGMAGTTATNLQAEGFTGEIHPLDAGAEYGPAPGAVTANTVMYGGDRADTASAVAEALGISGANVQESADVAAHPSEGVWVIIVTPPGA